MTDSQLRKRYQQYKTAFHGRPLPFAFVDMDLLDANVQQVLAQSGGKWVRVASKSVRSVAILPLCLDIDMSTDYGPLHFGVWRSTIQQPDTAVTLARQIANSPHLVLDGLMGYEAQIAGLVV